MNLECKYCNQIIHWQFRNGKWYAFDDMCNWYLHRCQQYKKREGVHQNRYGNINSIAETQ